MKSALLEINDLLLSLGMKQCEIDLLITRLLDEETENFVKYKKEFNELMDKKYS